MLPLRELQQQFTACIRDPKNPLPADVPLDRMQVYQSLMFNNIEGFLSDGFPILRSFYSDAGWQAIVRNFLIQHYAQSPYFREIGQEFLNFLQAEKQPHPEDPAFLLELAHYEWIELALLIDEAELPTEGFDAQGNLLLGVPVLSPLAWLLSYHYPVHRIQEGVRLLEPSASVICLILYRTADYQVNLLEINEITFHCLSLLKNNPEWRGEQILQHLCELMQHPNPDVVIEGGRQTFEQLHQLGILLGTKSI